jgi:glycosyltransferase involved in cell wall biosynthesis
LLYREGDLGGALSLRDIRFNTRLNRLRENWIISRSWAKQANGAGIFINQRWIHKTSLSYFGEIPDIVHLHLVHRWLDLPYFLNSIPEKTRIVWSLHDLHPLTGGCTHAIGCQSYKKHCGKCPNLKRPSARDQSFVDFQSKKKLYQNKKITFVANSRWTQQMAQLSALVPQGSNIPIVPLGVDANQFQPIDKLVAKQALQIPQNKFVIGFGCSDLSDANKGMRILLGALRTIDVPLGPYLLYFGSGSIEGEQVSIPSKGLGRLHSPELQALFYSACDLFVVPSLIETFCLTALESMACGTPVLAYRTGGLPDLIEHGKTGLLADMVGSLEDLAGKIQWALVERDRLKEMGEGARSVVEKKFTAEDYAKAYETIYHQILAQ